MLVQRTVAQLIELRARPPAAQQAKGTEAVRDQRDQVGLDAGHPFFQPLFAARGLDRAGQRRKWNGVTVDETFRNKRAQERTWVIG